MDSVAGRCPAPAHPEPPTPTQHGREAPAAARRVVQLLLRHEVVDQAVRAEGLAVHDRHPPLHLRADQVWIND